MLTLLAQVGSIREKGTAPAEDVASSWPGLSKGLEPASSSQPPILMPRQPSVVPENFLQTLQLQLRGIPLGKDSTITKEHTPTPESAALKISRSNGEPETLKILDTKNMEEAPAEIEPPSAAQDGGVKPEEATTGPLLRLSQHNEAGSLGSAVMKDEDAHPEEPAVKPRLHLDHIREVSTASATPASDPTVPAGDAPSYLPDDEVSEIKLTKLQRKRMREMARKRAEREENCAPLI